MTKRIELRLYKALGVSEEGDVKMIDYFFQHEDEFKGVTGSSFYFVSPESVEDRNDLENIEESYSFLWSESVAAGKTEKGLSEFLEDFKDSYLANGDGLFVGHDTSYIHHLDRDSKFLEFFNALNGLELRGCYDSDRGTFECVGGGRCFDATEEDLKNYENDNAAILHDLARAFEADYINISFVETVLNDLGIPFEKVEK